MTGLLYFAGAATDVWWCQLEMYGCAHSCYCVHTIQIPVYSCT